MGKILSSRLVANAKTGVNGLARRFLEQSTGPIRRLVLVALVLCLTLPAAGCDWNDVRNLLGLDGAGDQDGGERREAQEISLDRAREALVEFMDARVLRKREEAESLLSDKAKGDYSRGERLTLIGASNPHMVGYFVSSSNRLSPDTMRFNVWIQEQYTGEAAGFLRQELITVRRSAGYLIDGVEPGDVISVLAENRKLMVNSAAAGGAQPSPQPGQQGTPGAAGPGGAAQAPGTRETGGTQAGTATQGGQPQDGAGGAQGRVIITTDDLPASMQPQGAAPGVEFAVGREGFSALAPGPGARRVAFGSYGVHGLIGVVDTESRDVKAFDVIFEGEANSIAWSTGGRYIAVEINAPVGGTDVLVYDAVSGERIHTVLEDTEELRPDRYSVGDPRWVGRADVVYLTVSAIQGAREVDEKLLGLWRLDIRQNKLERVGK